MQADDFSAYQAWIEAEMACARGVRGRKWVVFWKVTGLFFVTYAAIALICFVVDLCSEEELLAVAVVGTGLLFILSTLVMFLGMLPGFFLGGYARKIKRAVRKQGFDELQREQFAREQMEARSDPAKSVSLVITQGQDRMPAQFTLSEHFACLTGGSDFGPHILNVEETETVHVSMNTLTLPVVTRVFCMVLNRNQNVTTYTIRLEGHGKVQGWFRFGDPEVCKKVLDILYRRFLHRDFLHREEK